VFRPDRIAAFVPAMLAAAERRRRLWLAQPSGAEIEVGSEMMRTTFEVILQTMLSGDGSFDPAEFGRNMTASLRAMNWAVALSLLRAPGWVPYPGKRRTARNRDEFRAEMGQIVAGRRTSGRRANDLVTLLLEATDAESGQAMSDLDIVDNLRTFVAAGHETTAQALTWSFYLLSLHRDSEARILREVDDVTGGRDLLPEHVERLSYTRQAIQEAMRLYPPAPLISRDATHELRLGDEPVAAGTTLLIPIYAVHRHKSLWPDPDGFDPDRFAHDAVRQRHRYSYIPFGAGPRICIGMNFALTEATAILASLVRAVRLDLPEDFTPKLKMGITLRAGEGMRMLVRPR
jgi:cytochrome P450